MSRSEDQALAVVDRAVAAGILSRREADHWRAEVRDPCGCAEGLVGAGLAGVAAAAVRHDSLGELLVSGTAGVAVGALAGKVLGVARGLHLVRHQRTELRRRVAELTPRARVDEAGVLRTQ